MSRKKSGPGEHFRPTIFKIMATEDKLTAAAGLATIMEVFDQSPLSAGFKAALPARSTANRRSGGSYRLGLIQLNSFIYGHDSLDDLEEFRDDPLLEEAMKGEVAAPKIPQATCKLDRRSKAVYPVTQNPDRPAFR